MVLGVSVFANPYARVMLAGPRALHLACPPGMERLEPREADAVLAVARELAPHLERSGIDCAPLNRVLADPFHGFQDGRVPLLRIARLCAEMPRERYLAAVSQADIEVGARVFLGYGAAPAAQAGEALMQGGNEVLNRGPFASKYDCIIKLGGGAQSEVFLAQERATGRLVVARFDHNPEDAGKLKQRMHQVKNLNHPGIVKIREVMEEIHWANGTFDVVTVMDAVPGGRSLRSTLVEGRIFPEDEVWELGAQLLAALEAAHAADLIHRDVKPSNILVSETEGGGMQAQLIDFGVAKHLSEPTQIGSLFIGTSGWQSHEQLKGQSVRAESDRHQLGMVLVNMLRGEPDRNDHRDQPELHDIAKLERRGVSPQLIGVLKKLVSEDAGERNQVTSAYFANQRQAAAGHAAETALIPAMEGATGVVWPGISQPLEFPVGAISAKETAMIVMAGGVGMIGIGECLAAFISQTIASSLGGAPFCFFGGLATLVIMGDIFMIMRKSKKNQIHYVPGKGFLKGPSVREMLRSRAVHRAESVAELDRHRGHYVYLDEVMIDSIDFVAQDSKIFTMGSFRGMPIGLYVPEQAGLHPGSRIQIVGKVHREDFHDIDRRNIVITIDTWTAVPQRLPPAGPAPLLPEAIEDGVPAWQAGQ